MGSLNRLRCCRAAALKAGLCGGVSPSLWRVLGMQAAEEAAGKERTLALESAAKAADQERDRAVAAAVDAESKAGDERVLVRALGSPSGALPCSLAAGSLCPPACMPEALVLELKASRVGGQPEQAPLLSRRCAEGWPVRGCEPLPVAHAGHAGGRGGCGQGAHAGAGVGGQAAADQERDRAVAAAVDVESKAGDERVLVRALGSPSGALPCSRQPLPACMRAGGLGQLQCFVWGEQDVALL